MTRLLRYTLEQWDILRMAPWMAAIAVMESDSSGPLRTSHEVAAASAAIAAAAEPGARRHLAYRVAEELTHDHGGLIPAEVGHPTWITALRHVRETVSILDAAASAPDSADYRAWLGDIADHVARAAREGFAGLGARVSRSERAIIDELKNELRIA